MLDTETFDLHTVSIRWKFLYDRQCDKSPISKFAQHIHQQQLTAWMANGLNEWFARDWKPSADSISIKTHGKSSRLRSNIRVYFIPRWIFVSVPRKGDRSWLIEHHPCPVFSSWKAGKRTRTMTNCATRPTRRSRGSRLCPHRGTITCRRSSELDR